MPSAYGGLAALLACRASGDPEGITVEKKPESAYGRVKAVAEYCGVSERTIRRWMDLGMPYVKPDPSQQGVVLISWEALDAWLADNTY